MGVSKFWGGTPVSAGKASSRKILGVGDDFSSGPSEYSKGILRKLGIWLSPVEAAATMGVGRGGRFCSARFKSKMRKEPNFRRQFSCARKKSQKRLGRKEGKKKTKKKRTVK